MEELHQLQAGPKSVVTQPEPALQFGTLATSSPTPVLSTAGEASSSSIAAANGNIRISPGPLMGLVYTDVILGLNTTSTNASMTIKAIGTTEKMVSSTVGANYMLHNEQGHFFQHTRLGNNQSSGILT